MSRVKNEEFEIEIADPEEDGKLTDALLQFSTAADKLRNSYSTLKSEIRKLNLELDSKNYELERNLEEKEKVNDYLDNILKSLNVGVIVLDKRFRVTTFNHAAERMTGLGTEEVVSKDLTVLKDFVLGRKILDCIRSNGSHQCSQIEFFTSIPRPSYLTASVSPLRNKNNTAAGIVVIIEDITSLKKLEEQARRANRMTAMGEMAAKIAHEIRNPLGSIELCASALKKELKTANLEHTLIDHVLSGVKTLNNVVSNMLIFTKSAEPVNEKIDLIEVIDSVLNLSHYLLKKNNITLKTVYQGPSLFIHSDKELLKQLFLNLVLNAAQAMPDGGELTVFALVHENHGANGRNGGSSSSARCKRNGDLLEIRIKDTGPGIQEDIREKIFDPFFTTKESGTGLGLAIVHNIVKKLKGTVEVESKVGRESVFSVVLPRSSRAFAKQSHGPMM